MSAYRLLSPTAAAEWSAYHAIRRQVLFEARGRFGVYDETHPDERAFGNHPKLLLFEGEPVGVVRIDIVGSRATFRRVAVRSQAQRSGHGRMLLLLAEDFARAQHCHDVDSHVAADAIEFWRKCGFTVVGDCEGSTSILVTRAL
jgi:GNAT superfamily N-acetyltransferase